MDLTGIMPALEGLSPVLKAIAIVAVVIIYKALDILVIQPKMVKGNSNKALEEKFSSVEVYLTNHLTTSVEDLRLAIKELTASHEKRTEKLSELQTAIAEFGKQVTRQGDIQIATSRYINEFSRVIEIFCDRENIRRPKVNRLPESNDEVLHASSD